MAEEKKVKDPFGKSSEEQTQKHIFHATFSMLAKLTSIDGKVSKHEVQIIDRFMKEVLVLDSQRRAYAIKIFNDARRDSRDFEHFAKEYAELMEDKPKMREWMIDVLLRVSLVDKEFSNSERHLLEKACRIFEISDERWEELSTRYIKRPGKPSENKSENKPAQEPAKTATSSETETASSADDPYKVLKISPDADDEAVLAAYRHLSVEYGPSRIIELGLPDEFVQLAEEMYAKIQAAYREIKSKRKST